MTRTQVLDRITAEIANLPDERLEVLAEIVTDWAGDVPIEDRKTRKAIAEGLAQARRGEFATEDEVAQAFARFRR